MRRRGMSGLFPAQVWNGCARPSSLSWSGLYLAAFPTEELSELAVADAADVMRGGQAAAETAETRRFGSGVARKVGVPVSNRHAAIVPTD